MLMDAINQIEHRRSMYIGGSFESLVAFLVGYSTALKQHAGVDLMEEVRNWVKEAYGAEFAVMWPYFLLAEGAKGDEAMATKLCFDTIADFVAGTMDS